MRQETIPLDDLELDPSNPRLPEDISHDDDVILHHVLKHGTLDELAYSFLDNGYFEAERLIVIPSPGSNSRYTVVEGNRRLATLLILHGELGDIPFPDAEPTEEQLNRLREVPCLVVEDREEVDRYLAYRHIGGMKTWGAEARARFTKRMVDDAGDADQSDPFKWIGKQIGSNAQGVRNSYLAITVLEHARDTLDLPTRYLQYDRFGVWIRCMNSSDVRSYLAIGSPRSLEEIRESVGLIAEDKLREVVADLSKRPDDRRPLVADSRDITDYGRILLDNAARSSLRKHEDFEVARQIVQRKSLPGRVESVANSVSAIIDELSVVADHEVVAELHALVERLNGLVRSLRAIVRDLAGDDD